MFDWVVLGKCSMLSSRLSTHRSWAVLVNYGITDTTVLPSCEVLVYRREVCERAEVVLLQDHEVANGPAQTLEDQALGLRAR